MAVTRHYGGSRDASGYSAVVAPSATDAWAFGGTNPGGGSVPVALRWNGKRWRPWPLPPHLTGFISDASAPSGRDIWAVSYDGGYALHWNGTRWSVAKRWRHPDVLTGVTALGPADVWIFGTTAAGVSGMGTWHFNGHSWARVAGPPKQIYRASAVSRRDIWAVAATRRGSFVEHYDGHAWRRVRTGHALDHASLDDVLALSRNSVWVVGNLSARRGEGRLVLAHFDGRRWTQRLTPWHADTGRLAPDGFGGVWVTADQGGTHSDALVGHLPDRCQPTWAAVQHGLGSGVTGIATSRGTRRVWLSGGFLTKAGGDAAVWAHGSDLLSRGDAEGNELRPGIAPLDYRSWRLDLAVLLRVNRTSSLLRPAKAPAAA
jgi:hypothetical protein